MPLQLLVLTMLLITLSACGGGNKSDEILTGYFIDSPVEGLTYVRANLESKTNFDGSYYYQEGEELTFYIGKLKLGSSIGKKYITPLDFSNQRNYQTNLVALLQSLDINNDSSDGISLPDNLENIFTPNSLDFSQSTELFYKNSQVDILLAKAGKTNSLNSAEHSSFHFQRSIQSRNLNPGSEVYSIGGLIIGLNGVLELEMFNEESIIIDSEKTFRFSTKLLSGSAYSVGIKTQPQNQICQLIGSEGVVRSVDVTSISLVCEDINNESNITITGLQESLTLISNDIKVTLTNQPEISLPQDVLDSLRIHTQPRNQLCQIIKNSNIEIQCTNNIYSISATLSGLTSEIVLKELNSETLLHSNASGNFTLDKLFANSEPYSLTVLSSPLGQSCTINNATGIVEEANVSNINVTCEASINKLSIEVIGNREPVDVVFNENSLQLSKNAIYSQDVAFGTPLNISINSISVGQQCDVISGLNFNSMPDADVTIQINCTDKDHYYLINTNNYLSPFSIIKNDQLTIDIQESSKLIGANVAENYNFNVKNHPIGQTCIISESSGTVNNLTTNLNIDCVNNLYNVNISSNTLKSNVDLKETVTGVVYSFSGETLSIPIHHGETFNFEIVKEATGQSCALVNNTSTINGASVTVNLICEDLSYELPVNVSNSAAGIVLLNNGKAPKRIVGTSFYFDVQYLEPYNLTIETNPLGQSCTFDSNNSGIIAQIPPSPISVECIDLAYELNVTVNNLFDTQLLISNNGLTPDSIEALSETSYKYIFNVLNRERYSLTLGQAIGQTCSFEQGVVSGTISAANKNHSVICDVNPAQVVFDVQNLDSNSSVIMENTIDGTEFSIVNSGNIGNISFNKVMSFYSNYSFIIKTSPAGQTCSFTTANTLGQITQETTGPFGIKCDNNPYNLVVTANNIKSSIEIHNNRTSAINITNSGIHNISVNHRDNYALSLESQPVNQLCELSGTLDGEVNAGDINNISLICLDKYQVSGTVTGLIDIPANQGQLEIFPSWKNEKIIIENPTSTSDETYTFTDLLVSGTDFTLSLTQPHGHTCTFGNGSESIDVFNIQSNLSVDISCIKNTYTIQGIDTYGVLSAPKVIELYINDMSNPSLVTETSRISPTDTTYGYVFDNAVEYGDEIKVVIGNGIFDSQYCDFDTNYKVDSGNIFIERAVLPNIDLYCVNTFTIPLETTIGSSSNINLPVEMHVIPRGETALPLSPLEEITVTSSGTLYSSNRILVGERVLLKISPENQSNYNCDNEIIADFVLEEGGIPLAQVPTLNCAAPDTIDRVFLISAGIIDIPLQDCILLSPNNWEGKLISDVRSLDCSSLTTSKIQDITGLSIFTSLEDLNLSNNEIVSLQELSKLPQLDDVASSLTVTNNVYPRLDSSLISNLVDSQLLSCISGQYPGNTRIDLIDKIDCQNQSLVDISGIELFTSLNVINLNSNQIIEVSPISKLNILPNKLPAILRELILGNNVIQNIGSIGGDGFHKLRSLQILDLENNSIIKPNILQQIFSGASYYLDNLNYLNLINVNKNDTTILESTLLQSEFISTLSFYNDNYLNSSKPLNNPLDGADRPVNTINYAWQTSSLIDASNWYEYTTGILTDNSIFTNDTEISFSIYAIYDNDYDIQLILPNDEVVTIFSNYGKSSNQAFASMTETIRLGDIPEYQKFIGKLVADKELKLQMKISDGSLVRPYASTVGDLYGTVYQIELVLKK